MYRGSIHYVCESSRLLLPFVFVRAESGAFLDGRVEYVNVMPNTQIFQSLFIGKNISKPLSSMDLLPPNHLVSFTAHMRRPCMDA